jgi:hypothetical protein
MAAYDGVLSFLYLKDPIEKQTDFSEPDEGALDPQDFTLARARWPKKTLTHSDASETVLLDFYSESRLLWMGL